MESGESMDYEYHYEVENTTLYRYSVWYSGWHGYVSVVVCVIGVVCNILNIVVLTHPRMRSSTNWILTALAVADLLTMLPYIPFAILFYCLYGTNPSPPRNNFSAAYFKLFHVNFSVTAHTISIWLGVLLSVYRYYNIRHAVQGTVPARRYNRIFLAILGVYLAVPLVLLPTYVSQHVKRYPYGSTNESLYDVTNEYDVSDGVNLEIISTVQMVNFWIHAVLIKIVPCVLMCLFGTSLVCSMRTAHERSMKLRKVANSASSVGKQLGDAMSAIVEERKRNKQREHSRTTGMLVMVLILFLLTELPQGIMVLCSDLVPGFFMSYYVPLGDTMDIVALVNNGINFTLYCGMSRQFRDTFCRLVGPRTASTTTDVTELPLFSRQKRQRDDIVSNVPQARPLIMVCW